MSLFENSKEGVVWYMEETPMIDEEQAITKEVTRCHRKRGGGTEGVEKESQSRKVSRVSLQNLMCTRKKR